jgi:hypothetical protein
MTITAFFDDFLCKRYELKVFFIEAEAVLTLNMNYVKNILARRVYGLIARIP